jgi:hypothetical protein
VLLLLALGLVQQAFAQQAAASFRGDWEYAEYPVSRSELPPGHKDLPLREVPRYSVGLTIRQRGNRLSGNCGATARYLARLEVDSPFDAVARGRQARLELTSGFGGRVTVLLTLRSPTRLHWKIIKAQGEHYFPPEVTLRKAPRGRRG